MSNIKILTIGTIHNINIVQLLLYANDAWGKNMDFVDTVIVVHKHEIGRNYLNTIKIKKFQVPT